MLLIEVGLDLTQVRKKFIGFYAYDNSPIAFVNGLEAEVFVQDTVFEYYQKRTINKHLNREGVRKVKWSTLGEKVSNNKLFKSVSNNYGTLLIGLNHNILIFNEEIKKINPFNENWLLILNEGVELNEDLFHKNNSQMIYSSAIKKWSEKHQLIAQESDVRMMSEEGYFQIEK